MASVPTQSNPFVCFQIGNVTDSVDADTQWVGNLPALLNNADMARIALICISQLRDRALKIFEEAGGEAACLSDTSRFTQVRVTTHMKIRVKPEGERHVSTTRTL